VRSARYFLTIALFQVGGRFQIFPQLGGFGIRLTLDFIDLSEQEVCPGFAPGFVDLCRLERVGFGFC